MPNWLTVAQEPTDVPSPEEISACGDEPGALCEIVLEWTDSELAAKVADRLLATPAKILLVSLLALLIWWLFRRAVSSFVRRMETEVAARVERARELGTHGGSRHSETRRLQRLQAISGALRGAVGIVLLVSVSLYALGQLVDLRPILAGAGIAGLVVGFGAQNLIADFLAGISMLLEDQFGVGDAIWVQEQVGIVEHVGLRRTRLRDIDGVVWHVPNGKIDRIGNYSQHYSQVTMDVPLPHDVDLPRARAVIAEVAEGLAEDEHWSEDIISEPEIWGLQQWGPDGLAMRVVLQTRPLRQWDVARQLRERLKLRFDREGIRMPYRVVEVGGHVRSNPVRVGDSDDGAPRRRSAKPGDEATQTTSRLPIIPPEAAIDRAEAPRI